eukprot:1159553-Pelagomonas_calceolata.AAC.13
MPIQLHAFFLNWVLLQAEAAGARDEQEQRQADAGARVHLRLIVSRCAWAQMPMCPCASLLADALKPKCPNFELGAVSYLLAGALKGLRCLLVVLD